jgi:hypothetical protein
MSDTTSALHQLHHPTEVGDDFENGVFAKIRRVKRRRRLTATIAAPLAVVALVSAFHLFRGQPAAPLYTASVERVQTQSKEEVPLSADVFFAASDGHTHYSVGRVAYASAGAPSANQPIRQSL